MLHTVTLQAKNICIAVGGKPHVVGLPGAEHCITSDQALCLEEFPKAICIIGGGYIACEFAGIFEGFGSDTHLLYRDVLPLRGFDMEVVGTICGTVGLQRCLPTIKQVFHYALISRSPGLVQCRKFLADQMSTKGLNLHPGSSPSEIVKNDDGTLTVKWDSKENGPMEKRFDAVMMATGGCQGTKSRSQQPLAFGTG